MNVRSSAVPQRRLRHGKVEASTGGIEIDGVTARVGRGADVTTLMTVLRALKAGALGQPVERGPGAH